jgi:hypothetical protein
MVGEEGQPALARIATASEALQISGYRSFGDLEA